MNPALSAAAVLPLLGWSVHATALRHRLERARRDALTALPTREVFTARADRLLRERPALVVLIDLDRFKPLNDTRGHAAGDAALRTVGERLATWARHGGLAARIGGDEFVALLPAPADPGRELAALHQALTGPIAYASGALSVGASIGGHLAAPGATLSGALAAADAAMYQAKTRGGGWLLAPADPDASWSAPRRWKRNRPAPNAAPASTRHGRSEQPA